MAVRRNSGMHNIFRLDKRTAPLLGLGGKVLGGFSGHGGAYRLDRRGDGGGMHGIFRLDKRAPSSAAAVGGRATRAGSNMHSVFRLDRRSAGTGGGAGGASSMHDIFRLDKRR